MIDTVDSGLDSMTGRIEQWWKDLVYWFKAFPERWVLGSAGYALMIFTIVLIICGIALTLWLVIRHRRHIRQLQLEGVSRRDQKRLAQQLEFYVQMLQVVERAGYHKPVWETPAAFASMLSDKDPVRFGAVIPLTDLFYEIRFGGRPLNDERATKIHEQLEYLRKAVAQTHAP